MKNGIKKAVSCLLFIAILISGLWVIYNILSWKDTSGEYFSSFNQLESLPENSVEVVAVGSSRAYGSFNPAYYWKEAGIPSFTLGISGMARDSAYYSLKELLKTQSPKVVLVEGSLLYTDEYLDISNKYRNTVVMKPSQNNTELIKETVEAEEVNDYLLRFPIFHNRFSELKKNDFVGSISDRYALGYTFSYKVDAQSPDFSVFETDESTEPDEETIAWIMKMKELSEEEGFELVFFTAPQNIQLYYQKILNGCYCFFEKNGIMYVDLDKEREAIGLDFSTDFSDAGHINRYGADKVSKYLLDYLSAGFSFEDHRGDGHYVRWDDNVLYDSQKCMDHQLEVTDTVENILDAANECGHYIVVFRKKGVNTVYVDGHLVYEGEGELVIPIPGAEEENLFVNEDLACLGTDIVIGNSDKKKEIAVYDTITGYLLRR